MKTWRVTEVSENIRTYEVIAEDEEKAKDAVYWFKSSGRPTVDARKVSERSESHPTRVTQIEPKDVVCPCGHFFEHHLEEGCGWASCSCDKSAQAAELAARDLPH